MTASSAYFSVALLSSELSSKVGVNGSLGLDAGGIRSSKSTSSLKGLNIKVNAEGPSKVNGTHVSRLERSKNDEVVQDSLVFQQNFSIRSYEVGADRAAFMETLMNHLQETSLNHCTSIGLMGDGFGSTPEMCKRNLIWVVARLQVLVDRYPIWGDVVQVDTWISPSGKNGMHRDWLLRDYNTGEILARATSVCVMMNKHTRKLSKMPDEVREEIEGDFVDKPPVIGKDGRKLPKLDDSTAEHIRKGLTARWRDLDVNQHVNNVKYISWILESVPCAIMETCELASITLEYRRECGRDNVLRSLTNITGASVDGLLDSGSIECDHLLRLEDGSEVLRARTEWRPKHSKSLG